MTSSPPIESGGKATAKNSLSSAAGYGGFIDSTFLRLYKREFSDAAKGMSDGAILALKSDLDTSRKLVDAYARENALALQNAGFTANDRNLYLAHFLGASGAVKALQADPTASAADVLGSAAAKANPTVIGGGKTIADVLAYVDRAVTKNSGSGKAQTNAVTSLRAEADAYDKSTAAAERLKSIQEQLDADREKGGDLSKAFATAQDLISASSDKLTPALKAQRDEIIALADARSKAASVGLSTRFQTDLKAQQDALGRTSSEQQIYQQVKGYGYDPASAEGQQATAALKLQSTLSDLKSTSSSALSGFISDLAHGTTAAQALQISFLGSPTS